MFAKLARFRAFDHRPGKRSTAASCNDNHPVRRFAAQSGRMPRPVLVCGWQQVPASGALECVWHIESEKASPADEPGIGRRIAWRQSPPRRANDYAGLKT